MEDVKDFRITELDFTCSAIGSRARGGNFNKSKASQYMGGIVSRH